VCDKCGKTLCHSYSRGSDPCDHWYCEVDGCTALVCKACEKSLYVCKCGTRFLCEAHARSIMIRCSVCREWLCDDDDCWVARCECDGCALVLCDGCLSACASCDATLCGRAYIYSA
jgi:hypothetical protein